MWNLRKFDTTCSMACASFDSLANRTKEGVVVALAGTDTSNLKAKFRVDLSYTIPPLTLYNHKYRPGAYLIFGFPLVDVTTSEDNVPKVMRMCIDEIEKRGLNTKNIYSVSCSRHILGFLFSSVHSRMVGQQKFERPVKRPVESAIMIKSLADVKFAHSCNTGSKMKFHFHSPLRTTSVLLRCYLRSDIATTTYS